MCLSNPRKRQNEEDLLHLSNNEKQGRINVSYSDPNSECTYSTTVCVFTPLNTT
jgi:hypothetical protein